MVFSCAGCQARYRIDDKLFEGKVLRFSCRKCGQVHLLRDPGQGGPVVTALQPGEAEPSAQSSAPAPAAAVARPTVAMPTLPQSPAMPRPAAPAAPPAAWPSIAPPGPSPRPLPGSRPTTTTRALPAVPGRDAAAAATVRRDDAWFAIKQGQRLGPFTRDALQDQLLQGLLHDRSFVWRPTMASWIRMNQVAELAEMLASCRAEFRERSLAGEPPPLPPEPSASAEIPPLPLPAAPTATPMNRPAGAPVRPAQPPAAVPVRPAPPPAPAPAPAAAPVRPGSPPPAAPTTPQATFPRSSISHSSAPPTASQPSVPSPAQPASPTPVPQPPSRRAEGSPVSHPRRVESVPPSPLGTASSLSSSSGARADELFLDLSRPTIDLRRAQEVQPDEPPMLARQRRPARPAEPAPVPSRAIESEDESPLFPDAFVAPEASWPSFTHDGGIAQVHAAAPAAAVGEAAHDPHMGVREFSVMVRRLGKQMRTRNLVKVALLSSAAVLLVGGLVTWILLARPDGDVQPMPSASAVPVTRYETPSTGNRTPRELPKASILENLDGPARAAAPRSRGIADEYGTIAAIEPGPQAPYSPPPPPPPAAPRLAQLDPSLRQDAQRYGGLLGTDALKREEAPTDIRPRTLTVMPKSTLNPQVMNDFLEKKHKKFIECKGAMKNPPEVPVKVGLSFDVGSDGRVGNVQVVPKDGIRDGSLTTCLRNVVLEWAFPAQSESTTYRAVLSL